MKPTSHSMLNIEEIPRIAKKRVWARLAAALLTAGILQCVSVLIPRAAYAQGGFLEPTVTSFIFVNQQTPAPSPLDDIPTTTPTWHQIETPDLSIPDHVIAVVGYVEDEPNALQNLAFAYRDNMKISPYVENAEWAIAMTGDRPQAFRLSKIAGLSETQYYLALASAGFDALSLGSEHSLEQGLESLIEAEENTKNTGLQMFGAYKSHTEKTLYKLDLTEDDKVHTEHRLGVLSYILRHSEASLNNSTEDEREYAVYTFDPDQAAYDAANVRDEGAVTVMAMIPIDMGETEPLRAVEEYARDLSDTDIDIIIGVQGAMVYGMSKHAGYATLYPDIISSFRYIRPVDEMREWERHVYTDGVVLHLYIDLEEGSAVLNGSYWPLITAEFR